MYRASRSRDRCEVPGCPTPTAAVAQCNQCNQTMRRSTLNSRI